jgi:hypothetical protein
VPSEPTLLPVPSDLVCGLVFPSKISIQICPSVAVLDERRSNGGKEATKKPAVESGGESAADV